ncbi:MAG: acyl-CoA dehydrogenase [Actinomycetota bacterium]|nr:acyl-CoA dehydrogenase [Actinomycetota bacterium]
MSHYTANLRDLEFNLFEVLDTKDRFGAGAFAHLDTETARGVLSGMERLATGPLAASYVDGDRNPPVFDPTTHSVTLPESVRKSYQAIIDGDWQLVGLPERLGGFGAPRALTWAINEMVLGANPALFMYMSGAAFAAVIDAIGTPEQKPAAQTWIDRKWTGTMVLTEPDAGSDVGSGTTKAVQQPDGSWHIEGVKRFISGAEHDLTEQIVHLVLARPEGARSGSKGLSLFIVPKYHCDWETGELGERNGVRVTNLEKKMGLKVSTTCEMTFGQDGTPALGWLVGDVHNGMAQMFKVIENARMFVGTKAIAQLSAGYHVALAFAKERIQGADLSQSTNKSAPRVSIIHHPDVRRSLLTQKAYAEGMRALYLYAASLQDQVLDAEARGEGDSDEALLAARVNDLLLPIVKGYGSERAYAILSAESLQTLGGSGYLQDYPIEQYIRDAKIDTLYEGTTAIQGMDFFFRKIIRDQGQALGFLNNAIQSFIDNESGNGRLKNERALLSTALGDIQQMVGAMIGQATSSQQDPTALYKVGQNTSRLLLCMGDLLTGWLLLRQAEVAMSALGRSGVSVKDQHFYEGKLAVARFFATQILPTITSQRAICEATDNAIMDLDEAAF